MQASVLLATHNHRVENCAAPLAAGTTALAGSASAHTQTWRGWRALFDGIDAWPGRNRINGWPHCDKGAKDDG